MILNKRKSGDHTNYCLIKVGQNTEESPGDLRKLVVTQNPVKKTSANIGVKNLKRSKNIINSNKLKK